MGNFQSTDPRAIQTRDAIQQAFIDLLQVKTYRNITVTDVTKEAGIARHTFYNHYETLDDLLSKVIDSVLENFFGKLSSVDFNLDNPEAELRTFTSFFDILKDNQELLNILNYLDIDGLIVERLKAYFMAYYYQYIVPIVPDASPEMAKYLVSFNAHAIMGVIKPWMADDMKYSPEVMAGFLIDLTGGSHQRRRALANFKHIIR
ncbi:MAG: TetR/AcrR family transcriptional regulator [Phototrophicaceae bacterium]